MKVLNYEKNQRSIHFCSSKRTRVNDIVCWFGVLGLFAMLMWLAIYMAIADINEYIIQIILFSLCLVGLAFLLIGAFYDTFLSNGFKLTIDESGIRHNADSKQYIISWEEFKICSVVWNGKTGGRQGTVVCLGEDRGRGRQGTVVCLAKRNEHHRAHGRGFLLCKKNFGTAYASKPTTP